MRRCPIEFPMPWSIDPRCRRASGPTLSIEFEGARAPLLARATCGGVSSFSKTCPERRTPRLFLLAQSLQNQPRPKLSERYWTARHQHRPVQRGVERMTKRDAGVGWPPRQADDRPIVAREAPMNHEGVARRRPCSALGALSRGNLHSKVLPNARWSIDFSSRTAKNMLGGICARTARSIVGAGRFF